MQEFCEGGSLRDAIIRRSAAQEQRQWLSGIGAHRRHPSDLVRVHVAVKCHMTSAGTHDCVQAYDQYIILMTEYT